MLSSFNRSIAQILFPTMLSKSVSWLVIMFQSLNRANPLSHTTTSSGGHSWLLFQSLYRANPLSHHIHFISNQFLRRSFNRSIAQFIFHTSLNSTTILSQTSFQSLNRVNPLLHSKGDS